MSIAQLQLAQAERNQASKIDDGCRDATIEELWIGVLEDVNAVDDGCC